MNRGHPSQIRKSIIFRVYAPDFAASFSVLRRCLQSEYLYIQTSSALQNEKIYYNLRYVYTKYYTRRVRPATQLGCIGEQQALLATS